MNEEQIKNKILDFLNQHTLGVVSTVDSDRKVPESAVVGFANNDSLELIFGTSKNTRKFTNIEQNPNVSFVIGWDSNEETIQYEGITKILNSDEAKEYINLLVSRNVEHKKYIADENQRYILVKPTWIRFANNLGNPPEVYEIKI